MANFTPSVTILETDNIKDTDDKIRTIIDEATEHLNSEVGSLHESATIATTKADEANNSAILASQKADEASTILTNIEIIVPETDDISTVANNITSVVNVSEQIVPNLAEILQADDNATTATQQANIATTKASEASISEANALTYRNEAEAFRNEAESFASDVYSKTETDAKIVELSPPTNLSPSIPYSGYTQVSKKLDNFVFETSSSFLNKVADKNRYVKFGDKVVDTYSHSSYDATRGGVVAQFQVPEVSEIITDGSNTTSVAVNAGDYVVDGSELVTNGTFDTDTSGWNSNNSILSIDTNRLKIVDNGAIDSAYQDITTVIGTEYVVTATAIRGTGSGELLYVNEDDSLEYTTGTTIRTIDLNGGGSGAAKFTATTTTTRIFLAQTSTTTGQYTFWDNISVKRVSDTFRAKQDAPIGTALTNTTYFEDRTEIGVTNQQLAYHAYNTLTNSYEGILTETLFSDVSKEDLLDNSSWLASNGFSKVSDFLYSKGSYLVLPVGIWQSLNKGAYHPLLNGFGTKSTIEPSFLYSRYWFIADSLSTAIKNTPMAFDSLYYSNEVARGTGGISAGLTANQTSDGISGTHYTRPDSKFYDICYSDQFIDVREYAKILNKYEVELIRDDKEENGVEEVVFTTTPILNTVFGVNYKTTPNPENEYVNYTNIYHISGDNIDIDLVAPYDESVVVIGIDGTPYKGSIYRGDGISLLPEYGDVTANISATPYIIHTGVKPILSSNTKLSIDLIGNPQFYPQVMKDRLASGVGVVGINPLLVGQDGTSYTTGNIARIYSDKCVTSTTPSVYTKASDLPNVIYYLVSNTINTITNTHPSYDVATYPLNIVSYTSKNKPYIQTTPKPDVDVEPKVIASNSHSIYRGALVGNQVSGKIQVGNGANGYESKVLENSENLGGKYDYICSAGSTYVVLTVGKILFNDVNTFDKVGYYQYIGSGYTGTLDLKNTNLALDNTSNWVYLTTIPTHSTIALDNANSPASKWFEVLEEGDNGVLAGVYGEELAYNSGTTSFDGDDDTFEQLTNGTITDLNGNTCRTFHGSIALNGKVK